ncbi:MAG TPA: hypothetical protein VFI08_15510, partial [Spirochaetia bacterium]|nr:hypothetical protein [Spirochaetia bacterium]
MNQRSVVPVAVAAVLAVAVFAALSGIAVVIFRGMTERNRLESRNDVEQTLSLLFTSLREYDDFGAAIEAQAALKAR